MNVGIALIIVITLGVIEILSAVLLWILFSRWNTYLEKRVYSRALAEITLFDGRIVFTWLSVRDLSGWKLATSEKAITLSTKSGNCTIKRGDIESVREITDMKEILRRVF